MLTAPIGFINPVIGGLQPDDFVFTQATTSTFQLPLPSGQTYNFEVFWGDGNSDTITTYNQAETLHTYSGAGTYQITIRGKCGGWRFNNGGDKNKMRSIDQWGDPGFDYLHDAFYGCVNMTSLATDGIKSTTITTLPDSFRDCDDLTSLPANLISGCPNITTLDSTFRDCSSLPSLPIDLFRYNTSITSFVNCFYNCSGLTSLPVDLFRYNTLVTTFSGTFRLCIGLASLPEDLFYYNANVSNYGTTFYLCRNIALPTRLFNLSNIPAGGFFGLFMDVSSTSNSHTGTIQDVWNYATTGSHADAFTDNISLTNYYAIPFDWKGMVEVGTLSVNITDYTTQSVDINRTYTGIAEIHWDDNSFTRCTSGAVATHNYASNGTYSVKLGAASVSATTALYAEDSRITSISSLKTGNLSILSLINNLLTSLTLTDAPINGGFYVYGNSSLSSVTHSTSDVLITNYRIENCAFSGNYNVQSPIAGQLFVDGNTGLTGLTFASSGNGTVTDFRATSTAITSLDFSNVPLTTRFWINNVTTLTGVTFASSGNGTLTDVRFYGCTSLTSLDFSNINVGTTLWCLGCTSLTSLTFASSGNSTVTYFDFSNCNLSSIDCSNVPLSTDIRISGNSSLSTFTIAGSGNGALTRFWANGCSLPNIDFSVFSTSDGIDMRQQDNAMTATEVDNQLINLDNTGWINGAINIAGTNAARTAASDTAYNNLITNGWSITVN
jgi:surface protein